MGVVYISSVGTSLLSNFYRDRGSRYLSRYRDLGEWARLSPSDERNVYPSGVVCSVLEDRDFVNDLVEYGVELRGKSCAEVNGLLGIQRVFGHRFDDVEIYLLYTRTCNTRLVTYVLRNVLNRLGFRYVVGVELEGIASVDEFDKGLVEVMDKISHIVRKSRGEGKRVYVNATPGFKAEAAFITIMSLLLGVDGVVYIHESFDYPILIPSIPITVRTETLEPLLKVFHHEDKVHINALLTAIEYKEYLEYKDKGVLITEGEHVKLRPWIKHLVELLKSGSQ